MVDRVLRYRSLSLGLGLGQEERGDLVWRQERLGQAVVQTQVTSNRRASGFLLLES